MSDYDPDELTLSRDEIMQTFSELDQRWGKNRLDNFKYMLEMKAIRIMFATVADDKLPYYWAEYLRINDALRTKNRLRNEAKYNKNFKILSDIQEQRTKQEIALVTATDQKRFEWGKLVKFGSMKNA